MNRGIFYAIGSYAIWGLYPFYFHAVQHIAAPEIVAHRILWSFVLLAFVLFFLHRWRWIPKAFSSWKTLAVFTCSSFLVTANWSVYVYAIITNQTLEASLGYFINPLFSVFLGAVVLKEKLRTFQKVALVVAVIGVAWITWQTGKFPFIGLLLALSFGLYGLIRKMAPLGSLEGLSLETAIATPFALIYLGYLGLEGNLALTQETIDYQLLLLFAGPLTVAPLLLFAMGLKMVRYSTIGFIQYINPTLGFLIGLFCFNEPCTIYRLVGFMIIWTAVLIFLAESIAFARSAKKINKGLATT